MHHENPNYIKELVQGDVFTIVGEICVYIGYGKYCNVEDGNKLTFLMETIKDVVKSAVFGNEKVKPDEH